MSLVSVTSQKSTLSFGGTIGHITSIDVSRSSTPIDVTGLSATEGDPREYESAQLIDGDEIKVEALYSSAESHYPTVGTQDAITVTVPAPASGGDSATFTGDATCTNVSVKYAVGDVVKLSLTFKVGGTLD